MRIALFCCFFLFAFRSGFSQELESGPMIGYVEHREALIWISVDSSVSVVEIRYYKDKGSTSSIIKKLETREPHHPVKFVLPELDMNTLYTYQLYLDGKALKGNPEYTFKTKELWEWRKPAPDFSFLIGSCAYRNDSVYDRPGKPYGQSPLIFETMASTQADFNIWSGDNLYFREVDFSSMSGMRYRYAFDRRNKESRRLFASRPNYAIWDDHDYGSNDANKSFDLKNASRELFIDWWGNQSFGENDQGIYSRFSWSDCDIFLLDDRWFRSANAVKDSIDGKPNPAKYMYGNQQLEWLKNSLLSSRSSFKFILSGGQVLNTASPYECLYAVPSEYYELLDFLAVNRIEGVIFLSGDRHLTEMLKLERNEAYPLYDFTCSPLTSSAFKLSEKDVEFNNPMRIKGSLITENNFSRISVRGERKNRTLYIEVIGVDGKKLWEYSIPASDLRYKK